MNRYLINSYHVPTCPFFLLLFLLLSGSIANAQNVGIGTASPTYKLQVESGTDNIMLLKTTSAIEQSVIFFQHANLNVPVGYVGASEGKMLVGVNALANPGSIQFNTDNTARMTIYKTGQVGIGPAGVGPAKLLVSDNNFVAGGGILARFQTNAPIADIEFWDETGTAGRAGVYYNWIRINANRTTSPESIGGIRFDIDNSRRVYITPDGNMGIDAGNFHLDNSLLGIRLNAADAPMITRRFDQFQSGKYVGIGRWGLFMEPSALTLGIPNFAGKKFAFATYEVSSNRNELITIEQNGSMRRPATGAHDLLPAAMGSVKSDGTSQGITGNFSSSRISTGLYSVDFTNFNYNDQNYIVLATPVRQNNTDVFVQVREGLNGTLNIFIKTDGGQPADQTFNFVVYKNF